MQSLEDQHKKIEEIFTYHKPQGNQQAMYQEIREHARAFAHAIVELTPFSREQSLAITNLQQAVMFANAAIAIHGSVQEEKANG